MGLNSYVAREPRALPIFILADTSGSMRGEKISELNLALREMLTALNDVDDIRGKFQLCVIGFGGDVNVLQPLADIDGLQLPELNAAGNTPMGEAFDTVREMIEDRNVVSSRAYTPTIVLISDGIPTDCSEEIYHSKEYSKWEPLNNLHSAERSSKSQRLALGIGADADFGMLKEFINNPEIPVIKANDASGITKFFRWVTMSTVARMNSVNPNSASTVAPMFDMDEEDIIAVPVCGEDEQKIISYAKGNGANVMILPLTMFDINSFRRLQNVMLRQIVSLNTGHCPCCGGEMRGRDNQMVCDNCNQMMLTKTICPNPDCRHEYYYLSFDVSAETLSKMKDVDPDNFYQVDSLYQYKDIVNMSVDTGKIRTICPHCGQ